jgi:hypothetical protein
MSNISINDALIDQIVEDEIQYKCNVPFLAKGLLGKCIFLFWYAKKRNNVRYKNIAYDYLDIISKSLNLQSDLGLYRGLLGIVCGYSYILQEKEVDGDVNEICREIDDKLFLYATMNLDEKYNSGKYNQFEEFYVNYMLYVLYRLSKSYTKKYEQQIYTRLLIKIFNHIYQHHQADFCEEPFPCSVNYKLAKFFMVIAYMYKLGIEPLRLKSVLNELKIQVLYKLPVSGYNRVVLYGSLKMLAKNMPLDEDWEKYIALLKIEIDLKAIVNQDIVDTNLFADSGMALLYLFLKYINREETMIEIPKDDFLHKIEYSSIWNQIQEISKSNDSWIEGLNGRLGLIMMYYDLK